MASERSNEKELKGDQEGKKALIHGALLVPCNYKVLIRSRSNLHCAIPSCSVDALAHGIGLKVFYSFCHLDCGRRASLAQNSEAQYIHCHFPRMPIMKCVESIRRSLTIVPL